MGRNGRIGRIGLDGRGSGRTFVARTHTNAGTQSECWPLFSLSEFLLSVFSWLYRTYCRRFFSLSNGHVSVGRPLILLPLHGFATFGSRGLSVLWFCVPAWPRFLSMHAPVLVGRCCFVRERLWHSQLGMCCAFCSRGKSWKEQFALDGYGLTIGITTERYGLILLGRLGISGAQSEADSARG